MNLHADPSPDLSPDLSQLADAEAKIGQACRQWHRIAGEAVAYTVRSMRDADLRQLNDAIFRLRRARRNCEEGWLASACRDYRAVAMSAPAAMSVEQISQFACRPVAERVGR